MGATGMEKKKIDRAYLETLPYSALVSLADERGIDVPDDLNRIFLISDLLDVADEDDDGDGGAAGMDVRDEGTGLETRLPGMYNVTDIDFILRDPAWAFVWWNISEADMRAIGEMEGHSLLLVLRAFDSGDGGAGADAYEARVADGEKERYVMIPRGKKFARIDLALDADGSKSVLASSGVQPLPLVPESLPGVRHGEAPGLSEALRLSRMESLLRSRYERYRESFSE